MFDQSGSDRFQVRRHRQIADHGFLGIGGHETAGRIACGLGGSFSQFVESYIQRAHSIWIWLYVDLLYTASHRKHLGDAGNALEPLFNGPIGKRSQFSGFYAPVGAAKSHQHDLTHQGSNRCHVGGDVFWQVLAS